MKVIVNGRFLEQRPSGVQNYASGIVKSLLRSGTGIEIVIPPPKREHFDFAVKPIGSFNGFIWEQFFLPRYIRKQHNALLLNLCNSAPLAIKQKAVTIHDLAFEEDKYNWFSKRFKLWYKFLIPRISKSARVVFTVSEFSKSELVKHYTLPSEKIVIASPGLPEMSFDSGSPPAYDYVLLTGANNPRKNAMWVIENIDILKKNGLKLVLLGDDEKVFNNITLKDQDNIICLKDVSASQYFSLLKNAKSLIYPSVYEGFGIPILESLCLGVPVIASNIPAFKKSFGDVPLYFETGDKDSYGKAVEAIREKVISAAEINLFKSKYNYDASAKLMLNTIEALAS